MSTYLVDTKLLTLGKHKHMAFLVLLHFTLLRIVDTAGWFFVCLFFVFFYELNVCGNPALNKSVGSSFSTAFAHFMSMSHFCNSRDISDFFCYLLW